MSEATPTLDELRALGVLREVDVHFARAAARIAGEDDPLVLLGLALASRAPGAGHVCADLRDAARVVRLEDGERDERVRWPDADAWIARLRASAAVTCADAPAGRRPLVLDGDRLYLDRYWRYQERLVAALRARACVECDDVDDALLGAGLDRLFPPGASGGTELQRAAAEVCVRRALSVVTGGPGTGKTTTVLRVLALLLEQAAARGAELRVAMAAPTGKAAARMADSVRRNLAALPVREEIRARIPTSASTLHRLLGWLPATPTTFRHGPVLPLAADVVVVDEVSMVDVALMAKLVAAVRPGARLVLLGDRDQLASVEAGAILGDVCPESWDGAADAEIARCVTRLTHSHRFRGDGGIGALARAMNAGDADAACAACDACGEVALVESADPSAMRARVLEGYQAALAATSPEGALDALERFRVLTAHRAGSLGAAGLNEAIARWCEAAGLVDRRGAGEGGWYHGRPIIVTQNDYALELFNGDTGVILVGDDGRPRAWFRSASGDGVRAITPARLPAHESVYAMTVHRSQGSEHDEVLLVLPARPSRVLTRELLYTGVTRARRRVTIVGSREVLRAGIAERVQRASGLRAKLWGATPAVPVAPAGESGEAVGVPA